MASGPITSWQIDGKTIETVTDIIFLGSKITADGDCNHEIKRRLLLGRKAMTNLLLLPGRFSRANSVRPHRRQPTRLPRPWDPPGKNTGLGCHFLLQCMKGKRESEVAQSCATLSLDSILKSRDITLPAKVHLVNTVFFPVVMCGCENWTIKKTELQRIDAFELWCWRRLLGVPWTARRSTQSILKEISPGYSLEGLMLKLKLRYFEHLMRRTDSFEKTLMQEIIEGWRRG